MKKLLVIFLFAGFATFIASAQLPEKSEDISPLLIGEKIPDVELKATNGSNQQLYNIIGQKPTVLLFYRGGWCPYCNAHLAEIQEAQNEVLSLGYQIVAVSPDSPENLQATGEKQNLAYRLYSDGGGELTKAIGIAFKAPERSTDRLIEFSGGQNEGFLPVPSVFIVDTSGKIMFEYINPDYKTRLRADLLLAVLKNLKPEN
ncbi:MAG: peroxiredoxin-like family protein [Bacteroidota bacterium]